MTATKLQKPASRATFVMTITSGCFGVRRNFPNDRRQLFTIWSKSRSADELRQLGNECFVRLRGGEDETVVRQWVQRILKGDSAP